MASCSEIQSERGTVSVIAVIASLGSSPYLINSALDRTRAEQALAPIVNRLANEHSPYLREAAGQPVHWYPWSDEAFQAARVESKPVLLDIGALWCHWCHMMDVECYENPAIAEIINTHYIAIKVDRDERPDIDARYQVAVSAIAGQGGWPLTGFLTPEGQLFFGGTYFPPEERYGRPGFADILKSLAATFRKEPKKIFDSATNVENFLQGALGRSDQAGELAPGLIESALGEISREFDIQHGGFGTAPKFPHPSTLDLLLAEYDRTGSDWMLQIVTRTLRSMANGGIRDHLGGGFHRYSTDRTWTVPHFEKMLYDNAPLLKTYVHAYQLTGDVQFKEVALEIIQFASEVLMDPKTGCFRSSQDADAYKGDDGSFFTWKESEVRALLEADEFDVVARRFRLTGSGEMPHDPEQHVLFVDMDIEDIALELDIYPEHAAELLDRGMEKLRQARGKRRSPAVDSSIYAGWNGAMIVALFEAWKAFGVEVLKEAALATLASVLGGHRLPSGLISHRPVRVGEEAFLEDQTAMLEALIAAYDATGNARHLSNAEALAEAMITNFWEGGYPDSPERPSAFNDIPNSQDRIGSLGIPHRPIQDSPTPSPNSVAALALLSLATLTGKNTYRERAERILRYYAGGLSGSGIFAGTYFLALQRLLFPPLHVVVTAPTAGTPISALHDAAVRTFRPGKLVSRVGRSDQHIRPEAEELLKVADTPRALVCGSRSCSAPVKDPEELRLAIRTFDRRTKP